MSSPGSPPLLKHTLRKLPPKKGTSRTLKWIDQQYSPVKCIADELSHKGRGQCADSRCKSSVQHSEGFVDNRSDPAWWHTPGRPLHCSKEVLYEQGILPSLRPLRGGNNRREGLERHGGHSSLLQHTFRHDSAAPRGEVALFCVGVLPIEMPWPPRWGGRRPNHARRKGIT